MSKREWIYALSVWVVIGLALLLMHKPAAAHDHARPDLTPWFKELKSPGKGLCCSGSDAEVLKDAQWESKDGHYRVQIDGQWIDVPDDAVVQEPNLDGQTLVWPLRGYMGISIRCFLPGAEG
jgi:hypothetical protein